MTKFQYQLTANFMYNGISSDSNDTLGPLSSGDEKKFSEVYDSYYLTIYYFSKKFLGDTALSEDITADTFIKLWQEAEKKNVVHNVKSFLHITAKNACIDRLKMDKRRQERQKEIAYLQNEDLRITFNTAEIKALMLEKIYAEVEKLPKRSRIIFKLAYQEGLKNEEIARLMHISPATVNNQKSTALKKLRLSLNDEGWTVVVAVLLYKINL